MNSFNSVLLLLVSFQLYSQHDWKLHKEKNGIEVYSRPSASSDFNDIKVEMELTGNIQQFKGIIMDAEAYTKWSYATSVSTVVETISENEFIYYSVTEVPWPASDRDFYARVTIDIDTTDNTLHVFATALPNHGELVKNKVRIRRSIANWTITTLSKSTIHLKYTLELDPGGNMPAWLVNMFSTTAPLTSFADLKDLMIQLNK